MKLDPIAAIEACYGPGSDETWASGVLDAFAAMDQGMGVLMMSYDIGDPSSYAAEVLGLKGNVPPQMLSTLLPLLKKAPPEVVASAFAANPPVGLVSPRLRVWPPAQEYYNQAGCPEAYGVFAAEHDGKGILITAPAPAGFHLAPRTVHQLRHVSAHLVAAARLRERLSTGDDPFVSAEAVLDASGAVRDVHGEATGERHRLRDAVRRMERARGAARRVDPEEALSLWQGLVDGEWSLVDHVDTDRRRFVLARRNPPGVRDPRALTARERDVLGYAALGHSNKYIGYMVGLAPSTIAVHLESAWRKLGVGTRLELIAAFGSARRAEAPPAEQR